MTHAWLTPSPGRWQHRCYIRQRTVTDVAESEESAGERFHTMAMWKRRVSVLSHSVGDLDRSRLLGDGLPHADRSRKATSA